MVASFAIEEFGSERLQRLTPDEIDTRFAEFKRMTHFEPVGLLTRAPALTAGWPAPTICARRLGTCGRLFRLPPEEHPMTNVADSTVQDFRVADLSLAEFGRKEIALAEHEMPGLMSLRREYGAAQPLQGARITARCT